MEARSSPTLFRIIIAGLIVVTLAYIGWLVAGALNGGRHPRAASNSPRIVALSPALAIILRDLDLENRIVGRHAYDLILDKSVPVCGDQSGLDYERLIAAQPTHILMQWSERTIPPKLQELASQRGWKILNCPTLSLADIRKTVRLVAAEFSAEDLDTQKPKPDSATTDPRTLPAYLRVEKGMEQAWGMPAPDSKGPRILMLDSIDPPAALGPGSFHHELLIAAGGTPAITTGKPYITLDAEDVLRLAPEAIIVFAPRPYGSAPPAHAPTDADLKSMLGRLGTLDLAAVRDHKVAVIDDPLCRLPSSALIGTAEELRRTIAGWRQPPP